MWTYALAGEDTQRLLVDGVAPTDDLVEHARERDLLVRGPVRGVKIKRAASGGAHLPALLVFWRRHGGDLGGDGDEALVGALGGRAHHLRVDLCEHAGGCGSEGRGTATAGRGAAADRVLPRAHSTLPRSVPKASSGVRMSRRARPSMRRACARAVRRKSFSGSDGDGGRIVVLRGAVIMRDKALSGAYIDPLSDKIG